VHTTNEEGKPLANARVTLFWSNGTEIESKLTNATGYVVFDNMPSTNYVIKGNLQGCEEQTKEITLTSEDQVETLTLKSVPFITTPMGIATIASVTIAGIIVATIILIKKGIIRK